jgi:hypothetical protein
MKAMPRMLRAFPSVMSFKNQTICHPTGAGFPYTRHVPSGLILVARVFPPEYNISVIKTLFWCSAA